MLRTAVVSSSNVARRAAPSSARGASAHIGNVLSFHTTAPVKDEKDGTVQLDSAVTKSNSALFALPIGIAVAIPAISQEWFTINEETQLMACFVAFCVTAYTQGGDAIYKSLNEKAVNLLKEHNEVEDRVINQISGDIDLLKADLGVAETYKEINGVREGTYAKLNTIGAMKPKYDFKVHVERMIDMIATEETNVSEKRKTTLMEEATFAVTTEFSSNKALKKAALESAIAAIKGGVKAGSDPVQAEFVNFFKKKAAGAKKTAATEAKAERDALIAKVNNLAKNEGLSFHFDTEGVPKLASA